ncbi:hypothetical protein LXL04_035014 [Taraxacum kok-saghyz]
MTSKSDVKGCLTSKYIQGDQPFTKMQHAKRSKMFLMLIKESLRSSRTYQQGVNTFIEMCKTQVNKGVNAFIEMCKTHYKERTTNACEKIRTIVNKIIKRWDITLKPRRFPMALIINSINCKSRLHKPQRTFHGDTAFHGIAMVKKDQSFWFSVNRKPSTQFERMMCVWSKRRDLCLYGGVVCVQTSNPLYPLAIIKLINIPDNSQTVNFFEKPISRD